MRKEIVNHLENSLDKGVIFDVVRVEAVFRTTSLTMKEANAYNCIHIHLDKVAKKMVDSFGNTYDYWYSLVYFITDLNTNGNDDWSIQHRISNFKQSLPYIKVAV